MYECGTICDTGGKRAYYSCPTPEPLHLGHSAQVESLQNSLAYKCVWDGGKDKLGEEDGLMRHQEEPCAERAGTDWTGLGSGLEHCAERVVLGLPKARRGFER